MMMIKKKTLEVDIEFGRGGGCEHRYALTQRIRSFSFPFDE